MSNLNDLDHLTSSIAEVVYRSAPKIDWATAQMTARFSPLAEEGGRLTYEYQNKFGQVIEKANPDVTMTDELVLLTMKHLQVLREMQNPAWYQMKIKVDQRGKFNVAFEYMDNYQAGDIGRD
jgi:hypothetical protein